MADLYLPNVLGGVNSGFDRGRTLAFNQQAGNYVASGGQDQDALAQAAQINPGQALDLKNATQASNLQQTNAQHAQIVNMARMLQGAPDAFKDQVYQQFKPQLASLGLSGLPDTYNDQVGQTAQAIVNAYTPYEGPKVLAPGSQLVSGAGSLLHDNPALDKVIKDATVGPNGERATIAVNPRNPGASSVVGLANAPGSGSADFYQGVNDLTSKYGGTITSGVRSPEHNAEVGGVPDSQHITGTAADVVVSPDQKDAFIAEAKARGLQPIDEGDHVHLQNPGSGARLAMGTPAPKTNTWAQRMAIADSLGASHDEKLGMVLGSSGMQNAGASQLTPNALENATYDYLINKTLPPIGRAGQGQAQRTAIMNHAADVAKALDMTQADFATRAGQQKAYQGSLNAYQKRSDAMQGQEQSFLRNLDYAQQISDQIDRTGSPAINKWLLGGEANLGDPEVVKLQAALTPVAADYARIMAGSTGAGGTPVSTQQEAMELLRKELSQNQFGAVADVLRNDVHNQRLGVADQMAVIQNRMKNLGSGGQGGTTATNAPETSKPIPDAAITYLRGNPSLKAQFDEWYGPGAADRVLGGK